jgi:hypothetical protein
MVRAIVSAFAIALLAVAGAIAAWKLADGTRRPAALTLTSQLRTLPQLDTGPRLRSPDGQYEVSVTDSGIFWKGPGGTISVTGGGVILKSAAALPIRGTAALNVQGPQVNLCGSGGARIARVGDLVSSGVLFTPAPVPQPGQIFQGSTTVSVC